jgi:hypothetical protein
MTGALVRLKVQVKGRAYGRLPGSLARVREIETWVFNENFFPI